MPLPTAPILGAAGTYYIAVSDKDNDRYNPLAGDGDDANGNGRRTSTPSKSYKLTVGPPVSTRSLRARAAGGASEASEAPPARTFAVIEPPWGLVAEVVRARKQSGGRRP